MCSQKTHEYRDKFEFTLNLIQLNMAKFNQNKSNLEVWRKI